MRNLMVCAEQNLLMQLCVNLLAFYDNNRTNEFHTYIVRAGLNEEEKLWLAEHCPIPESEVTYLDPEEITLESLSRELPEGEEHALYTDYLTMIHGDIAAWYDGIEWPERIAVFHELPNTDSSAVMRYEYGEPWLDTLHTEDYLLWWQYAKRTDCYLPLMEMYVRDTYTSRQMTRAIYTEYLEHDRLHAEYEHYLQIFHTLTGK